MVNLLVKARLKDYLNKPVNPLLTDGAGQKATPLPKICHTYPAMMKLAIVLPYLKKIQRIYESRDTLLEFC